MGPYLKKSIGPNEAQIKPRAQNQIALTIPKNFCI